MILLRLRHIFIYATPFIFAIIRQIEGRRPPEGAARPLLRHALLSFLRQSAIFFERRYACCCRFHFQFFAVMVFAVFAASLLRYAISFSPPR
jgi:hypothetical protein